MALLRPHLGPLDLSPQAPVFLLGSQNKLGKPFRCKTLLFQQDWQRGVPSLKTFVKSSLLSKYHKTFIHAP